MLAFAHKLLNHKLTIWLLLFLPAPPLLADLYYDNRYYAEIMYETGVLATQLIVVALAITPLMRLFRLTPSVLTPLRWMQKRRRYIGVAAFGYAALHTIFYIREIGSAELIWLELEEISLAIGWIAMIILVALAATSNDWSVRKFGKGWKKLQATAYLAVAFTALHWWFIGQFLDKLWLWMAPLLLLQAARIAQGLVLRRNGNT